MTTVDLESTYYFKRNAEHFPAGLDYVQSINISYSEFYERYMIHNRPCVLKGITSDWPCQNSWVVHNKPNLSYFRSKYGHAVVPVANCDEKYFNAQCKVSMTMNEYADYWTEYVCQNNTRNLPCLYMKDWHFQRDFRNEIVYKLPIFFASDWLNEYLLSDTNFEDDYRFVYMGPRGSWTPFHSDVFSSFSWSVNICGKKKWVLYAPGEEKHLCDKFGKLIHSVEDEKLKDTKLFPYQDGIGEPVVLIQEVGDAVFVPSGWHHQVWNLDDTISINHNWINACNIDLMLDDILEKLNDVEKEISDCRDMEAWDDHCQLMLKSVYGMDLSELVQFIFYTAKVRLKALKENSPLKTNLSHYSFGTNHLIHDLHSLIDVLKKILLKYLPCLVNFHDEIKKYIEVIDGLI